jgi:hypothetical protein
MGSDQAGCAVIKGLGQEIGWLSSLNQCFFGQKDHFKKSSGEGSANVTGLTAVGVFFFNHRWTDRE